MALTLEELEKEEIGDMSPTPLDGFGTTSHPTHTAQMSSSVGRLRLDSHEIDDDESQSHQLSDDLSAVSDRLQQLQYDITPKQLISSYIKIAVEGDLAGFQLFWLLMSAAFIIMKIGKISTVVQKIEWWAIFTIPLFNFLLTAWFDYIIRKFQSTIAVESLRKTRFLVLWFVKIAFAIYVSTYWIWGPYSHLKRFENEFKDNQGGEWCVGQIICVYISLLFAVFMSEVMITTVLINSEQNLSLTRTPVGYRVILLIIRPFVWVYNRTMVMFLCFYAIYGLFMSIFMIGIICNMYCTHDYTNQIQGVGLQMLLVPFTVPNYLFKIDGMFSSWHDVSNENFLQTFVVVFLCQSFYVDILNSLWQFSRRYLKPKRSFSQKSVHQTSVRGSAFMAQLAKDLPSSIPSASPPTQNMPTGSSIAALK